MKRILDQIEIFLLCLTVFLIPIYIKITTISIGALFLIAVLKKSNWKFFSELLKDSKFYLFISPFIITCLGVTYSNYLTEAKVQIETVVSLVIFPFIFVSLRNNTVKFAWEYVLSFFVISPLFAYLICLAYAIPAYINSNDANVFFYTMFSGLIKAPHHLSYCVNLSIVFLSYSFTDKLELFIRRNKALQIFKVTLLIIFIVFIFQLSSKINIILLCIYALLYSVYLIRKKYISTKKIVLVFSLIFVLIGTSYFIPEVNRRFSNMYIAMSKFKKFDNNRTLESTDLRLSAIEAGVSIIEENFWIGVGSGDLSTEMNNYYKESKSRGAYIKDTKTHNQFLRTFAMFGVVGFVFLLSIFIMLFIIAIRDKNFLLIIWAGFMFILFLIEDIFIVQEGVIMFSLFSSYFVFYKNKYCKKCKELG